MLLLHSHRRNHISLEQTLFGLSDFHFQGNSFKYWHKYLSHSITIMYVSEPVAWWNRITGATLRDSALHLISISLNAATAMSLVCVCVCWGMQRGLGCEGRMEVWRWCGGVSTGGCSEKLIHQVITRGGSCGISACPSVEVEEGGERFPKEE